MFRKLIALVLALGLLATPTVAPAVPEVIEQAESQKKDCVVYVTKTGSKYHKGSCGYLRKSKIPMSRAEAIRNGYTPCKRCKGSDCERGSSGADS